MTSNPALPATADEGFDSPQSNRTQVLVAAGKPLTLKELGPSSSTESDEGFNEDCSSVPKDNASRILCRQLVGQMIRKGLGDVVSPSGRVDATLHTCCKNLDEQHEDQLHQLVQRLQVTKENRYEVFRVIAEELFEGQKRGVSWHRIVALFCFIEHFTELCQEQNLIKDGGHDLRRYVTQWTEEAIIPFVKSQGGWEALCRAFPATDSSDAPSVWTIVKWGAMGLGLATASSLFSR